MGFNESEFIEKVEVRKSENPDECYATSVIAVINEMFDEIDDELILSISSVIKHNPTLKERLRADCESRNMIKGKKQKEFNILDCLFDTD